MPDCIMLPLQYGIILKRWPNLKKPVRFTEWINWYKMTIREPLMSQCVDKYNVREYVSSTIGSKYLVELIQVVNDAREINFESLPDKFVIKTTDGGNGDNVYICRDISKINISETIGTINSWKDKKYFSVSREWAYVGAKESKIIVEELLEDDSNADESIDDYKFLCYNGRFRYLWVDKNRYSNHRRGFWDENLNFLNNVKSDHPTFDKAPKLPDNISEMISIAEKLSNPFIFARVDLYNIKGRIIFGEITFYPWSGYIQFTPDEFDFQLGQFFTSTHNKK